MNSRAMVRKSGQAGLVADWFRPVGLCASVARGVGPVQARNAFYAASDDSQESLPALCYGEEVRTSRIGGGLVLARRALCFCSAGIYSRVEGRTIAETAHSSWDLKALFFPIQNGQ